MSLFITGCALVQTHQDSFVSLHRSVKQALHDSCDCGPIITNEVVGGRCFEVNPQKTEIVYGSCSAGCGVAFRREVGLGGGGFTRSRIFAVARDSPCIYCLIAARRRLRQMSCAYRKCSEVYKLLNMPANDALQRIPIRNGVRSYACAGSLSLGR
jgi:hypothetical protein